MEDLQLKDCGWKELNASELQTAGGFSWKDFQFLVRMAKMASDFIDEYREDIRRGFNEGWEAIG